MEEKQKRAKNLKPHEAVSAGYCYSNVCLSVCPSVTLAHCAQTAEGISKHVTSILAARIAPFQYSGAGAVNIWKIRFVGNLLGDIY